MAIKLRRYIDRLARCAFYIEYRYYQNAFHIEFYLNRNLTKPSLFVNPNFIVYGYPSYVAMCLEDTRGGGFFVNKKTISSCVMWCFG